MGPANISKMHELVVDTSQNLFRSLLDTMVANNLCQKENTPIYIPLEAIMKSVPKMRCKQIMRVSHRGGKQEGVH